MWEITELIKMESILLSHLQGAVDSYNTLKCLTKRISLECKDVFDVFITNNNIPVHEMPQYYCSPIWGDVCSNFKWRYIIVDCENDYVLCLFRVVGLYSTQRYFTLSYKPLSFIGNSVNANNVLKAIKRFSCVKKIEVISNDCNFDEINFYNTQVPILKSWKLNKAKKLCDKGLSVKVFVKALPSNVLSQIHLLYAEFSDERFVFDIRTHDKYIEVATQRNMPVFVFYFNGVCVGVKVCSDDFPNTMSIHVTKDITTFNVEKIADYATDGNCELGAAIKRFLGCYEEWFVNNYVFEHFNVCAIYYDGLFELKNKGLIEHKREYYKNEIKYKFTNINDYEYI